MIVLPSHVPPSFLKSQRAPAGSSPTRGWFLLPEVGREGAGVLFPTNCSSSRLGMRLGGRCGMVPCCKNWPKTGKGAQQQAELKPLPFVLPKDVFHGVLNEPSPLQRPYPLQEALTPPKNCPKPLKPQTPHPQPPNPAPPQPFNPKPAPTPPGLEMQRSEQQPPRPRQLVSITPSTRRQRIPHVSQD